MCINSQTEGSRHDEQRNQQCALEGEKAERTLARLDCKIRLWASEAADGKVRRAPHRLEMPQKPAGRRK